MSKNRNHTIHFVKGRPPITAPHNANLMKVLLENDIPVASSCHGEGVCGKCRIQILQGLAELPQETPLELTLRERHRIPQGHRVSCQTLITHDLVLDAPYW
jgi:2Fe-2S ferredoxin